MKKNIMKFVPHNHDQDTKQTILNLEDLKSREEQASLRLTSEELAQTINAAHKKSSIKVGPSKSLMLSRVAERQKAKEATIMRLSQEELLEREQLAEMVKHLAFRDSPDVFDQVRTALNTWQALHPDDPSLGSLTEIFQAVEKGADLLKE